MKIGIINVNDLRYNETECTHVNFSQQKILDVLSDYITLSEVSNKDEMMQTILDTVVGTNTDLPIHTATVKNVHDDLYLLCHIAPTKEVYEELKSQHVKYNGIASYLTDTCLKIYGQAVIFKLNSNELETITLHDITEIFISKFVHKGVIVNTNSSMDEFKFIFNPVDWISPNEISKYKYHETEILGKVLMLFFDTTATVVNNIASKISGQQIKGRVIIGMRDHYSDMNDTDVKYEDIDINTFKQLLLLCNDPNQARSLTGDEDITGQVVNGTRQYNNFHKILRKRLQQ